jgi:hypothetical protein
MLNFQDTLFGPAMERTCGDDKLYVGAEGEERDLSKGKVGIGDRRIWPYATSCPAFAQFVSLRSWKES